jgi:hypothetical protein
MSAYVVVGDLQSSFASDVVLSVLRMQAPSHTGVPGFCVLRVLASNGKVLLESLLQLSVALVMVLLYFIISGVWAACGSRGRAGTSTGTRPGGSGAGASLKARLLGMEGPEPTEEKGAGAGSLLAGSRTTHSYGSLPHRTVSSSGFASTPPSSFSASGPHSGHRHGSQVELELESGGPCTPLTGRAPSRQCDSDADGPPTSSDTHSRAEAATVATLGGPGYA